MTLEFRTGHRLRVFLLIRVASRLAAGAGRFADCCSLLAYFQASGALSNQESDKFLRAHALVFGHAPPKALDGMSTVKQSGALTS